MNLDQQLKFEQVWDKGDYRKGSTAHRLVDRLMDVIPADASINDYGSGTGRAEVEIRRRRHGQRINMIDIASNALEAEACALLKEPGVTFTLADLSDLGGLPRAEWGICINVLMTVPPEDLNRILYEIRNTCDNLFFEVYDFEDERLGMQMTTVKMNAEQWWKKLSAFWETIILEKSPESPRRYIFICRRRSELGTQHNGVFR